MASASATSVGAGSSPHGASAGMLAGNHSVHGVAGAGAPCSTVGRTRSNSIAGSVSDEVPPPGVDMLVHTVSHKDCFMSVQAPGGHDSDPPFIKPSFSKFQPVAEALLAHIASLPEKDVKAVTHPLTSGVAVATDGAEIPVGISFGDHPLDYPTWDDFHLRKPGVRTTERPQITAVYFPLLALVLLGWQRRRDHGQRSASPMLCLISGSGQPNNADHNPHGNSTAGVALLMAEWLQVVSPEVRVQQVSSGESIFRFDENVGFVNGTLVPIIAKELTALVPAWGEDWRDHFQLTISLCGGPPARLWAINAGLRRFRPNYLHLYELKSFWYEKVLNDQDMDFHPFSKIETHPALALEQYDDSMHPYLPQLVAEIKSHRESFLQRVHSEEGKEIAMFWLRKTQKPVLSVLMLQKHPKQPPVFLRGINMEVSMPTGSLCSERNVIGTAFANDPSLKRKDLKMIAVLSMPKLHKPEAELHRANSFSSEFSADMMPHLRLPVAVQGRERFAGMGAPSASSNGSPLRPAEIPRPARSNSNSSMGSPMEVRLGMQPTVRLRSDSSVTTGGSLPAPVFTTLHVPTKRKRDESPTTGGVFVHTSSAALAPMTTPTKTTAAGPRSKLTPSDGSPSTNAGAGASYGAGAGAGASGSDASDAAAGAPKGSLVQAASSSSPRSPVLSSFNRHRFQSSRSLLGSASPAKKPRRSNWHKRPPMHTVVKALNPIAPCGACNEWLKKIAEVNPEFKVVTFSDSECTKIFVKPVSGH